MTKITLKIFDVAFLSKCPVRNGYSLALAILEILVDGRRSALPVTITTVFIIIVAIVVY